MSSAISQNGLELATRLPLPASAPTLFVANEGDNHSETYGPSQPSIEDIPNESATLPPADNGFGAWTFLASAFIVEAIVFGFQNAYGVFLEAYLSDLHYSSQKNAGTILPLIGPLGTGISYCSGPFVYPLIARYPNHRRSLMWFGALLSCFSLLAASYTSSVKWLLALQGVLYSTGGAILYTPCLSYTSEWFVRRRGLANGIMFAGTSIGGLFLPLILPNLIEKHGVSTTLRGLAVATICLLLPCLCFVRGRLPHSRVYGPAARSSRSTWSTLRRPSMWPVVVVITLQAFGYFVPVIWLPTYGSTLFGPKQSTVSLSLLNGASVFGRLALGFAADKYDPWLLALFTLFATSLSTFVLWGVLGCTYAGLLTFGFIYGALAGGFSSLFSGFLRPIAKDDPGLTTSLFGYLMFSRGVGNILSSPISVVLSPEAYGPYKKAATGFAVAGGRYERMIIYVGTCFAGAALIASIGWGMQRWSRLHSR